MNNEFRIVPIMQYFVQYIKSRIEHIEQRRHKLYL